ncbi:MAG: hypothetical protein Q7S40_00280 [Opitutaceae bacterium]|nr:hypothetical protein [Opitutaceae bacterium]
MPSSFERSRASESPEVATYRALRAAGSSWVKKIMRHPATKRFDVIKAAKKLTVSVDGRTLVFEDETESSVLMDYFLFDYRPEGKSVVESCVFAPGEFTRLEADLHQAKMQSRTSLFEVVAVHEREPKLILRDRLVKGVPDIDLIDVGFSETVRRSDARRLLFIRLISVHGLHMTSGFSFTFDPRHEFALIDEYRRALWSAPAQHQAHRRMVYYLGLKRRIGLPQAYADVVPSVPLAPDRND